MSGFENWKTPCKVKRENLVSLSLTGVVCESRDSSLRSKRRKGVGEKGKKGGGFSPLSHISPSPLPFSRLPRRLRDSWLVRDWRARVDSLIKTRTRRAWKGFRLLFFFSRFQESFLLELISCWVVLPKGWTNVVYFSVKICELLKY